MASLAPVASPSASPYSSALTVRPRQSATSTIVEPRHAIVRGLAGGVKQPPLVRVFSKMIRDKKPNNLILSYLATQLAAPLSLSIKAYKQQLPAILRHKPSSGSTCLRVVTSGLFHVFTARCQQVLRVLLG